MRKMLISIFLLLALAAVAQEAQVEITSEPSHHLVLQNDWVRVFDVTIAPKTSSLVHRHRHDYMFVTLGDSDVTSVRVNEKPVQLVLKDGEAHFTAGGFAHAAINNSSRPFRNITIEMLTSATGERTCNESCSVPLPCNSTAKSACPAAERLFLSDQWTATTVTLPPGAQIEEHTHMGPHLAVAVSDLHFLVKTPGRPDSEINTKVGDIAWVPPTTHTVINVGRQPARMVTLEFRGNPAAAH
jgi:quercetin dioxygenase-like cupin family protein